MGSRVLFVCLSALCLVLPNFSPAQSITSPSVIIQDHNGNSNPISIDCDYNFVNNQCVTLQVEYPEIKNPTDYTLSSIPFTPVGTFSEGNEISIDSDDKWSTVQKLPFNFCFYGNTFNSVIVGDNGVISFDTEFAGTECPYTIAGSIPSKELMHNAIFGAYHDMTNDSDVFGCTSDCGQILLYVTGTAPYRKAVINYHRMNHFGCEEVKSTLQIVLYETTNIIDIYIKDKPYTCEIGNEQRALIGISNGDGSKGLSPEGRNTGIWEEHNKAWRFTPSGASTTSVTWYDSTHKPIGSGDSITVCPAGVNSSYSAEVTYSTCTPITLKNSIQITYSTDYPTAQKVQENECFEGTTPNKTVNFEALIPKAIGNQTGITTSLHNTEQDAISGTNPVMGLDQFLMNTLSKTFYLRVQKTENCFVTTSLTINLKRTPIIEEGEPIFVCTTSNPPSELIYLPNYNSQIHGYESWMKLEYFSSLENATNNVNPITSLLLSNTVTIYVRASNPELNVCNTIIPVTFTLQTAIQAESMEVSLCDSDFNKSEPYDLTLYEKTVPDSGSMSFDYYISENDAAQEKNAIANPESYTVKDNTVIYVKIKKTGYCPTIKTITFKFKTSSINDISDVFCDDGSGKTVVNLHTYYNKMVESANVTLDGFYLTSEGAATQDPSQLIPDPGNFTAYTPYSIAYVRFTDNIVGCTFIKQIKIEIIKRLEKIPYYEICDLNNDGQEDFQLSVLNPIFFAGYPSSVITYYATLEDYNTGKNPITHTLVKKEGTSVYIKIQIVNACEFLYKIDLGLIPFNLSKTENINLCDNLNDGKETYDLTSLIKTLGFQNYVNVKFYKTENDSYNETNPIANTSSYTIDSQNTRVYLRVNYKEGCPEIVPVQFTLLESVKVLPITPLEVCDQANNGSTTIDLTPAIQESGVDVNKITVEFYISQKGAESQNANEQIQDITSFPVNKNTTVVYIRFQNNSTGCYTVTPLTVKMNPYPIVVKNILSVCDFGNDGSETIVLSSLNSQLVSSTNGFTFTYFLTEKDALNSQNPQTSYNLTASSELYVKIASGADCFLIQKINFKFLPPPSVYNQTIDICDNNDDNQEIVNLTLYEKELTGNSGDTYSFSYFSTYDNAYTNKQVITNPKSYTLRNFPVTIYVRITNASSCFSIAELTFKTANIISAENKIANICDNNSDMQEYVNLENYISEMLISSDQNLVINYYQTENGANSQNSSDLISNPSNYSATLAQSYVWVRFDNPTTGCYTVRFIEINLIPLPKLINGKYLVCDTDLDGIYSLDLDELRYVVIHNPEGFTFTYYHTISDAQNSVNEIKNPHNYIVNQFNEDIIVKATNQFGCSSIKKVTLYTQDTIPVKPVIPEIQNCDNDFDGITLFDLTSVNSSLTSVPNAKFNYYSTLSDAQKQTNPIPDPIRYNNINAKTDQVYVRISHADYCPSLGTINLTVLPLPTSTLNKEYEICPNGSLELDAGYNDLVTSYLWSTGETTQTITIHQAGTYSVTLTGINGCQATYTTQVSEYAPIIISDLLEGDDYITVIANGPTPLSYSMDNINWQADNTFRGLKPGIYTFYVRSEANGCISPEKKGVIFKITNVITPNGDGQNDTWNLCGLENFDSRPSTIKIFDRYGKAVFSESSTSCFVWDGHHLGRPLPSTSYWYVINIADGRQFTGWIALRNYTEYR